MPEMFKLRKSEYELVCGLMLYKEFKRIWGNKFTPYAFDIEGWADTWGFLPLRFTKQQLAHGLKKCEQLMEYPPCPAELIKACNGIYDSFRTDTGNKFGWNGVQPNKENILS